MLLHHRPPSSVPFWIAVSCLAAVFVAKAAFLLSTPMRALVMSPWLIDDSFITMQVAKNVALGHGFSFDGTHLTTGVSPLWTYLIATLQMLFDREAAVRATLLLSTAFGTACAFVVYRIARALTDDAPTAVGAGLLAALLPVQFFNAMNGMETAFFSLAILLGLSGAANVFRYGKTPARHGTWTGVFLGIALLTRADAIFAIAAVLLWKAAVWVFEPKRRADVLAETAATGFVIVACFAVFVGWQAMQTGSPFPDNQVGRRAIALEKHGFTTFAIVPYLKISTWNAFELDTLWSLATGSSLLTLLALCAAWIQPKLRPFATLSALYVGLFFATLCLYQWYFPDFHGLRYLSAASHAGILCTALLGASLLQGRVGRALLAACAVVLVCGTWYRYVDYARGFPSFKDMTVFGQRDVEKQDRFWSAIGWVGGLPDGTVIGLRDHGRMAFFGDKPVQDLAGILDGDVLAARDAASLGAYLLQRNMGYVFLPEPSPGKTTIYQRIHEGLRLERVANAPTQEITGFAAYKVLGPRL